ncbi:glycosyltransferase family 4 protein [Chitinophaga sp. S165]|uniref:glycosyltransferase family 4 protein n=1 Tax=Chitinophaga sp. S165 TaxID=2135462 RepID=UPI000D70B8E7|nr:glycosyltransferase family 4 protein [Chitinophaga sp. S165]PWV53545.1 glycosyltransferase involved in cell wall biosynthesis [Chitinophaga sp. S165]
MRERRTSITFLVPGRGTKPVGGFRVVYEYANRLHAEGYHISIVHLAWLYKTNPLLAGIGRYFYCLFFYPFHKQWLPLAKGIKNKWIFAPVAPLIPDADYIVATSWETSEYVAAYPDSKGKKLYLIQADESEFTYVAQKGQVQRALDTWRLPLHMIAICTWLKDRIQEMGSPSTVIFNGLNFKEFYVSTPPAERDPATVMMLYHFSPHKGCEEGIRALRLVKAQIPALKATFYGIPPRPEGLEEWIEYYQTPSRETLRELYNRTAVFLSPSHSEGWGLPVSEAMQCGCAVVTTNIGGFKDFVSDNINGLCFNVSDIEGMAASLQKLITDRDLRLAFAERGHSDIQQFTWEQAVAKFIHLLKTID